MNNYTVKTWAIILAFIGLGIAAYKHFEIGFPLSPQASTPVWTVQAQISFVGNGGPAKVSLDIPKTTPGFMQLDEDFISSRFGLSIDNKRTGRKADWAIRRARGEQRLYYRISVAKSDETSGWSTKPAFPKQPVYPEPYSSAIKTILEDVRTESADIASFTRELLLQLNSPEPNENVELIRDRANNTDQWTTEIIEVLKGVRIPARKAWGLDVSSAANTMVLEPMLQIHNGREWITYNPVSSAQGIPPNFLIWKVGEKPVVTVEGGQKLMATFSATRSYEELIDVVRQNAQKNESLFTKFSLLSLPVQNQNTYQLLLTVPLGALLVVFIRTFVGLQTFGTFMPILIALAFRETQLFWGIIIFCLIVSLGLMIRFYLEKLMLLLVPRLASILVIVVIIMLLISMLTNQLGVQRLLSISLFPMVILAMTIERMSIVWEENGSRDAMLQGVGSLVVASLGYLIMTHEQTMYLMFVFPELLLVILGLSLWMGRYTGYRLLELFRFSDMKLKDKG